MVIVPVSKDGVRGARGAAFTPRRPASSMVGRGTNAQDVFAGRDIIRIATGGIITDYPSSSDTDPSRGGAMQVAVGDQADGDVYLIGPNTFESTGVGFTADLSIYGCGTQTVFATSGELGNEVLSARAGTVAHLKSVSSSSNYEPLVASSTQGKTVHALYVTLVHNASPSHGAFWPQPTGTGVVNVIGCDIQGSVYVGSGTGGTCNISNSKITCTGTTLVLCGLVRASFTFNSARNVWTHDGSGNADGVWTNSQSPTATFTNDTITLSTGTGAAVNWDDFPASNLTMTGCTVNAPKDGDGVIAAGFGGTVLLDACSVFGTSNTGDDLVNSGSGDTFNITNNTTYNSSTGTISTV